jgi:hypothetical protein
MARMSQVQNKEELIRHKKRQRLIGKIITLSKIVQFVLICFIAYKMKSL